MPCYAGPLLRPTPVKAASTRRCSGRDARARPSRPFVGTGRTSRRTFDRTNPYRPENHFPNRAASRRVTTLSIVATATTAPWTNLSGGLARISRRSQFTRLDRACCSHECRRGRGRVSTNAGSQPSFGPLLPPRPRAALMRGLLGQLRQSEHQGCPALFVRSTCAHAAPSKSELMCEVSPHDHLPHLSAQHRDPAASRSRETQALRIAHDPQRLP